MVELVDSLDSGSSVHCGRAGSSPASPTRKKDFTKVKSFFSTKCVLRRHVKFASQVRDALNSILCEAQNVTNLTVGCTSFFEKEDL